MAVKLHVLGLPHTETTKRYLHCAYTQKVLKFCDMMTDQGYEVILYAGEENSARCAEHVPLISWEERTGWFGQWDPNNLFENIDWDPSSPWWHTMNERAISEIQKRAEPQDFLCMVTRTQEGVAHALPHLLPVEWAVGYEGIRLGPQAWRVFESYAWMHFLYGKYGINDGLSFDAVIPNFFDPNDFEQGRGSGGYLVFMGRIVSRKGPHVAAEIAKRAGMKLVIAGPGVTHTEPGKIVAPEITILGDHVEYVGPVGLKERSDLLRDAAAAIVPTLYIEPFGGVAVEAMFAGTPVIASDWGAFTETVQNGVSGHRFRTLADGANAVEKCLGMSRGKVAEYAYERYSLQSVGEMFDEHFQRLSTLWGPGWYA